MFAKTFALAVSFAAVQAVSLTAKQNLITDPVVWSRFADNPIVYMIYDQEKSVLNRT